MREVTTPVARPGLRERKKLLTRQAILDSAERLFEERGFDGVTVAQIADAANVSVKTLFTYFDTKEDLVFADEHLLSDAIIDAVRSREPGQSALAAVRDFLQQLARRDGGSGLEGYHQAVGQVASLHSRLLLLFERYENALAPVLAEETGAAPGDPRAYLAATQLIGLLRLITSPEMLERVQASPEAERTDTLVHWIGEIADHLGQGLAEYAVRPASADH
ncbi:TetR/AcrR family transcriptional regulator [Streptomyces sp. NPDC127072]|uniref:TetR/AcrR family transcriptional regulator n=1 Tax=Streptomyces sp. NPDC127072 TaxID=3347129 RepID=UPI0036506327